jgi:hypothetical protein
VGSGWESWHCAVIYTLVSFRETKAMQVWAPKAHIRGGTLCCNKQLGSAGIESWSGRREECVGVHFMLHFSRTIAKLEGHIRRPCGEGWGLANSQLPCAVVPKGKHRCDRGRPGPSITLPQHLLVTGFWGPVHHSGKKFPHVPHVLVHGDVTAAGGQPHNLGWTAFADASAFPSNQLPPPPSPAPATLTSKIDLQDTYL